MIIFIAIIFIIYLICLYRSYYEYFTIKYKNDSYDVKIILNFDLPPYDGYKIIYMKKTNKIFYKKVYDGGLLHYNRYYIPLIEQDLINKVLKKYEEIVINKRKLRSKLEKEKAYNKKEKFHF